MGGGCGHRRCLGLCNEDLSVGSIPSGNLMAPPDLSRDAPRLNVAHPLEVNFLPALWNDLCVTRLDAGDGALCQFCGIYVPLVGQPGLRNDAATLGMRHGVRVGLDLGDKP